MVNKKPNQQFSQHIKVPQKTMLLNISALGQEYFTDPVQDRNQKIQEIEKISQGLDKHPMIGDYQNNTKDYFDSIDLYMTSSYEKEHRFEIFQNEIINYLNRTKKILDIGIGKSELTRFVSQYFEDITVVEPSKEALSSMPDNFGTLNASVTKISTSILEHELNEKYDLIILSHTLYHIENKYRMALIEKLYSSLEKDGTLAIVYNDGRSRDKLVNSFDGENDSFGGLLLKILSEYGENAYALQSTEIMNTETMDTALVLADLIFSDAGITAPRTDVASYLESCCYDGSHYQLETTQNFIFINYDENPQ